MSSPRTTLGRALATAAAAAVALGTATAGTASAEALPECGADRLTARVDEVPWAPEPGVRLFAFGVDRTFGPACAIVGGELRDVRFHAGDGSVLDVPLTSSAQPPHEVIERDPAQAFLSAFDTGAGPYPAVTVSFTMPALDVRLTVPWPSALHGPVRLGALKGQAG
ncbi:hypothetical protein KCV87_06355 [Actinosynnema pretiosum subsp. pretiosum]|uniref:DUF4232 domain-containing protein n=1 Tax=Actinosynnema pretiosum subsp. pretiosum TaxID=103721 RepID=A0AA45L999_9PSEU|nr:hypothetical protein APASM_2761 [Actinosynnema pretiosum subsp. pretiosum]QUF05707.1 hypothetical protein KCV87_06355 [Actinosynnema pretiosum subsp. pretiosum]